MRLPVCLFISFVLLFASCGNKNKNQLENQSEDTSYGETTPFYINKDLTKKISPAINKWLEYYDLNIDYFYHVDKKTLNLEQLRNDTAYPYYGKFEQKDDVYIPNLHDYSSDRTKYINLLAATNVSLENDGKYYFRGSDDNQQLGLYDREAKTYVMFSYRGINEFADAVFWLDDNTFILVGYNTMEEQGCYYIEIYELKSDTCEKYILPKEYTRTIPYNIVDMRARKIIIE